MKNESLLQASSSPSLTAENLYERMLLTRLVDEYVCALYRDAQTTTFSSCRGYEAAQVGSAACIAIGQDFTLPYNRDLGVFLTIGMTPYEVFRAHLTPQPDAPAPTQSAQHVPWRYHKHNIVIGPAPAATQILHAAGIAFASKLRKVPVVTIAYCGDDVVSEPDFLEGIRFSAHHRLPIIFVCEHRCQAMLTQTRSCLATETLPRELRHESLSGVDVVTVYETMHRAMHHTRNGLGPVLLEVLVPMLSSSQIEDNRHDPLAHCIQALKMQGKWNEQWAIQVRTRLLADIEQAMRDARRDTEIHDA